MIEIHLTRAIDTIKGFVDSYIILLGLHKYSACYVENKSDVRLKSTFDSCQNI